jgi:hypothetical protein
MGVRPLVSGKSVKKLKKKYRDSQIELKHIRIFNLFNSTTNARVRIP